MEDRPGEKQSIPRAVHLTPYNPHTHVNIHGQGYKNGRQTQREAEQTLGLSTPTIRTRLLLEAEQTLGLSTPTIRTRLLLEAEQTLGLSTPTIRTRLLLEADDGWSMAKDATLGSRGKWSPADES
jgi:predicted DNA-binding transcriptional regulator AlpA